MREKTISDCEIILACLYESARLAEQGPHIVEDKRLRNNRELAIIGDLIEEKYVRGSVLYHQDGVSVRAVAMGGITLKGRFYRDEIVENRRQKRLIYRLGRFTWAVGGWLTGVATVVLGAAAKALFDLLIAK